MSQDKDDDNGFPGLSDDDIGNNPFDRKRREEHEFDPFDDDTWEEPDRDTDHTAAYGEELFDEEENGDLFPDDDLFEDDEEAPAVRRDHEPDESSEPEQAFEDDYVEEQDELDLSADFEDEPDEEPDEDLFGEPADDPLDYEDDPEDDLADGPEYDLEEDEAYDEPGERAAAIAPAWTSATAVAAEPDWAGEDDYRGAGQDSPPWPFGLIAVAVLALVLLVAGGYGVIQQRKATEDEIRELRAELATAASPRDVDESRNALQAANSRNEQLSATITELRLENSRLVDTVAGLEAQLEAAQLYAAAAGTALAASRPGSEGTATSDAPKPAPAPEPEPAPAPASPPAPVEEVTPAPPPANGGWFVNFGSYGQRDIARDWVPRLNPGQGQTILAATEVNGRTLYRVRVVGLPDKASAEAVARQLEKDYKLSKLWVGRQ